MIGKKERSGAAKTSRGGKFSRRNFMGATALAGSGLAVGVATTALPAAAAINEHAGHG